MKFQLVSDVHTEFYKVNSTDFPEIIPYAEVLVLAGDIGNLSHGLRQYIRFINENSKKFKLVIIVMGNHESYNSSIEYAKNQIQKYISTNVFLLDKDRYDIDDNVTVLGCTLWSKILDHQKPFVKNQLGDFMRIEGLNIYKYNELHETDVNWLTSEIEKIKSSEPTRKILVVTHHAPLVTGTSAPQFDNSKISSAFSSDLISLMNSPVNIWVFGHTHYSSKQVLDNGINVISNQMGYPGETNTGYKNDYVFEIN